MGNIVSRRGRRQHSHSPLPPPPLLWRQHASSTRYSYFFLPSPFPRGTDGTANSNGRSQRRGVQRARVAYVEHKNAVTIKNDVNVMKESLRVVRDENNDGNFVVEFTLNANVAGSITVMYFAKVTEKECPLIPTKKSLLPPVTVHFQEGLGQKLKQPSGTGIDFSMFEDAELSKESSTHVVPLALKAEVSPAIQAGSDRNPASEAQNSQITLAVFEKKKGEYLVRVIKQILWVDGTRYELREIYGMGNLSETGIDGDEPGKVCVICLTEARETTTFPCLHMCMCSGCAKVLRFRTNRCPICRQRIEKLLEIKANNCPAE